MVHTAAKKYRVGELRPSQALHTFGVGAIVDLPHISAMVMGLEDWPILHATEIGEPRLLQAIQSKLNMGNVKRLLGPPRQPDDDLSNPFTSSSVIGMPVTAFPQWMLCPFCHLLARVDSNLFDLKVDKFREDRTRYEHTNCRKPGKPPVVVPVRFLTACLRGHLDEFPWHYFVHRESSTCVGNLSLNEFGGLGDTATIQVKCAGCNKSRQMSEAFGDEGRESLPQCRGRHPHLRDFDDEPCSEQLRTILLGASNSWFGLTMTALSVPVTEDHLGQLVDIAWHVLDKATSKQNVELLRQIGQLPQFHAHRDEDIWNAVERKRTLDGRADEPSNLKIPEWRVFSKPDTATSLSDFRLREVDPPAAYTDVLRRVVLVERLREVSALIGFTRIASPDDFSETLEVDEMHFAPLSRSLPQWVPAAEVHGEGIFLQFDEQAIQDWRATKTAWDAHDRRFQAAHRRWRTARHLDPQVGYPGLRYIVLHSFSHALMRQLSLECGYTLASLRERIYALDATDDGGPMAGVLLYTAAADSEGTLGGLVHLGEGKEFGRHIDAALDAMRLCASDPHCAEHVVAMGGQGVHGACCHACLLMPETSCERGNRYLDRSVLVRTVEPSDLAFFNLNP